MRVNTLQAEQEYLDMVIEALGKEFTSTHKLNDWFLEKGERGASWLNKALDLYIKNPSPATISVARTVFNDLTNDTTSKCFNLETLMALANRYLNDVNFAWFINSNLKVMSILTTTNPFVLSSSLFMNENSVVEGFNSRQSEGEEKPFTPRTWMLKGEEYAISETLRPTQEAAYFLIRRPWITMYLTSLVMYQLFYDIGELHASIENLSLQMGTNPPPNPDDLSTDIPFPQFQSLEDFIGNQS